MGRPLNIHKFGGPVAKTGAQLKVKAKILIGVMPTVVTAGLIQQKKQREFRVVDGAGHKGLCTFVVGSTPGTPDNVGEMCLKITPVVGPAFYAKKITNRFVWDFAGNKFTWAFSGAGKIIAENA